jgi:hypothetical protein
MHVQPRVSVLNGRVKVKKRRILKREVESPPDPRLDIQQRDFEIKIPRHDGAPV